jgi:hypothetical protein
MRLAVTISFRFLGAVRANSFAVLRPIPEEAPVITIVLPSKRLAIAEAIVRLNANRIIGDVRGSGGNAEVRPREGEES